MQNCFERMSWEQKQLILYETGSISENFEAQKSENELKSMTNQEDLAAESNKN